MATYDLTIDKGATFSRSVLWKDASGSPINLTGYTARLQIRRSYNDAGTQVSLSTDNGLVLGGSAGTVLITLTAAQTSAVQGTRGVYDLELVSASGVVTRLLQGSVEFTPEVTR